VIRTKLHTKIILDILEKSPYETINSRISRNCVSGNFANSLQLQSQAVIIAYTNVLDTRLFSVYYIGRGTCATMCTVSLGGLQLHSARVYIVTMSS